MVERVLEDAARAYGLRSVALRYFNSAGADPTGNIGESHMPETHLIPNVLRAALGVGDGVLKIMGTITILVTVLACAITCTSMI
ncbi:hypothetical protein GCM10010872_18300 [Dyella flava]|nr:hypothetical protein GCM10010872_18300 [Dyella flava]